LVLKDSRVSDPLPRANSTQTSLFALGRREKKNKIVEEGIQKSRRSDKRKFGVMAAFEKRIFKPFALHFTKIHFIGF
jgi:hypothetical protein